MPAKQLNAIILAGQRGGVPGPLADHFNQTHKCLIPLHGQPLIGHVIDRLAGHDAIDQVRISVEPALFQQLQSDLIAPDDQQRIIPVAAADNLADSVIAAMARLPDRPTIITTADNALLTRSALDQMAEAMRDDADAVVALAPRSAVLAAHPDGQRRFYKFADDQYSNCNLYGINGQKALAAAEIFRGGGQFAKKASRIIQSFGLINLVLLRSGLISLEQAVARVAHRAGIRIQPVVLEDGCNAIDVDHLRSYKIVAQLIAQRAATAPPVPVQ